MQRHNALVIATLALAGPLVAQPTLDFPADGPSPMGAPYAVTTFTTPNSAQFVPAGNAGADQTYGYWMVPSTGNYDRFLDEPSVTPSSTSFSGVTVLSTNGGQDTSFYKVDAEGVHLLGIRGSLEGVAPFSDAALELKFPCTFGTTWSDAFACTYTVSGFPVNRAGTVAGIADGYGSIQLPQQQIDDVLRVKVRKVQIDQSAIVNAYRTFDTYYYFQAGLRYPLMKASQDTVILGSGSPAVTYTAEWLYGAGDVGMSEADAAQVVFTPYPNPTNGSLDLRLNGEAVRSIEVFDATGSVVRTESLRSADGTTAAMDLSGLSAGVYQVRVTQADGRRGTQRVVLR
ncbi:MAG: T9SS type A sorting domain-containing protein [Flavobacteriales bacterium]|nr:T9SS type A sorting domain-containing protein [Flavobacteriales bacterium]